MSPFDERLLDLMHQHHTPLHSRVIADLLGGVSDRTARMYLKRLETEGYITRPSPRGGWQIKTILSRKISNSCFIICFAGLVAALL